MRRRRVLACSAAAVGFAGCLGNGREATTPAETSDGSPTATANGGPTELADGNSTATRQAQDSGPTTRIGGSLNGRPYRLGDDLELIEKSNATWIHAFLDVREKYEQDVTPEDDPDVIALRRASREMGAKLYVSLQWNFIGIFGKKVPKYLPPPGSFREEALIDLAVKLLTAIQQPVDVICLGNEPLWETPDRDLMGRNPPIVRFTRKLKDYLVDQYTVGDPRFLLGAFNRLFSDRLRREFRGFYRQFFDMARDDDDIDGIDLHVHYDTFQQAETMLEDSRQAFPDGMITATEFSPMWRYDRHVDTPVTAFDGGGQFADRYGIPEGVTVTEYFEAAKDDRLSRREMADFMEVMPWYNVNFVEDMYDLLNGYDVTLGTFGFLVESDVDNIDWTDGWAPFPINCLFQPALIDTEDGAHPHYLDDFRNRA